MKYAGVLISGAFAVGSQALADEKTLAVNQLNSLGLDQNHVIYTFRNRTGINLNPNEMVRVSKDEEGKTYRFETLDHLSIILDIHDIFGVGNKDIF